MMVNTLIVFMLLLTSAFAVRRSSMRNVLPTIKVGVIGHTDHGKTSLTAAITKIASQKYGGQYHSIDQIQHDTKTFQTSSSLTFSAAYVEYSTTKRHYIHVDFLTHDDYMIGLITGGIQMDAAILVVSVIDGPMPRTREQVELCRQAGVSKIVVFFNKCDMMDDAELLELIEIEVRELLSEYGFSGDDTPVIYGSARQALQGNTAWGDKIVELLDAMDSYIPEPEPNSNKPFLMPVADVISRTGTGTIVSGRIEKGTIKKGQNLEIVSGKNTIQTTCINIELSGNLVNQAISGDYVGIILSGIRKEDIKYGQLLTEPGTFKMHTYFYSMIYIRTEDVGSDISFNPYIPHQFHIHSDDITGTIILSQETINYLGEEMERLMINTVLTIDVKFSIPVPLAQYDHYEIYEGDRIIAIGTVLQILD